MEEEILLNIEFNNDDVKDAIKNISESRKQIDLLIEANKQLAKSGEKNSEAYVKNQETIKALNTSIAQNSKVIQANTQATEQNIVNVNSLNKRNAELVKLKREVAFETEEGRKALDAYNAEIDENNAKIASTLSGDEKRIKNIGNYSSALSGIHPQLGAFAGQLGTATESSGGLVKGLGAMTKASLAFIATPIGAIIAALVVAFKALETFVTGSTEGMDLFEDVTASVGVVIDVVTDRVVGLVKGIGALLSGDFTGGLEQIEDSFSGIGDEIEREVELTLELNKAIRNLEDAEINYDIAVSKNANTIKELILQSKNRTLAESERIELLKKADKLEADRVEQFIENRKEALRIANEEANRRVQLTRLATETEDEFAQRLIDTGLLLDPLRDKVKDAVIAYNNALGDGIAVREKIQNQIDALAEKAEAEAQKRADAEAKRQEELAKKKAAYAATELAAANELELFRMTQEANQADTAEERTAKLIAVEETRRDQILANAELTASQRILIEEQTAATISQIKNDAITADNAEAVRIEQEAFAERLVIHQEYVQGLINEKKRELLEGVISREEYDKELADLQIAADETLLAIKEEFGVADVALEGKISDQKIAIKTKEVEMTRILEKQKVDAVAGTIGQVAGLFNRNSVAFKSLASAQALIQTYQSAQAAFTGMTSTIPGPVGIALGVAAAAAAVINGLRNVAQINQVRLPKLEQGGAIDIGGKSHAQGGEVVSVGGQPVAEVQSGEKMVVLKRGAGDLLRQLGGINALAGGVDFGTDQAPRRYLDMGGVMARSAATNLSRITPQDIAASFKDITIVTKVTDIDRINDKREIATQISELS